jgi:hypothetical protein
VGKYWKFTSLKGINPPTEDYLINIKRGRWYCNYTGKPIKELHRFNTTNNYEVTIYSEDDDKYSDSDDDENTESSHISEYFYNKGYNTYHVYKCGHCFIDIYIISGLFDYINSCYSHMINLRKQGETLYIGTLKNILNHISRSAYVAKEMKLTMTVY